MSKTTRREMLKKVGAAGTVAAGLGLVPVVSKSASLDNDGNGTPRSATVSFGAWKTPLDRFTTAPPPSANHHELIPTTVEIQAGGTVNYIISGLHNIAVYDDGTQPGDIDIHLLTPPAPPLPRQIDDPNGRIYRGLDPRALLPTLDRVEVVYFEHPGTYLVICSVLPHFLEGMFGFVSVLPNSNGTVKALR
ncbi:MAG: twin-arginine translocation signal domain-containing protein [Pyrinomonadaceae bacterium]|nr:twin-arginine translocation signal domain-containing protein [Pyrinomonadaceae bacterium]